MACEVSLRSHCQTFLRRQSAAWQRATPGEQGRGRGGKSPRACEGLKGTLCAAGPETKESGDGQSL